jgi:hypothetical protein
MVVLRDSFIIADTTPRAVFSNRELMHSTHLTPPQVAELSLRLVEKQMLEQIQLSVAESVERLERRAPAPRPSLEVEP